MLRESSTSVLRTSNTSIQVTSVRPPCLLFKSASMNSLGAHVVRDRRSVLHFATIRDCAIVFVFLTYFYFLAVFSRAHANQRTLAGISGLSIRHPCSFSPRQSAHDPALTLVGFHSPQLPKPLDHASPPAISPKRGELNYPHSTMPPATVGRWRPFNST